MQITLLKLQTEEDKAEKKMQIATEDQCDTNTEWTKGRWGESCKDVCDGVGKLCDHNALMEVKVTDMFDIAKNLNVKCKHKLTETYIEIWPYIQEGRLWTDCYFTKTRKNSPSCTRKHAHRNRL